jgi:hypothetical protein
VGYVLRIRPRATDTIAPIELSATGGRSGGSFCGLQPFRPTLGTLSKSRTINVPEDLASFVFVRTCCRGAPDARRCMQERQVGALKNDIVAEVRGYTWART